MKKEDKSTEKKTTEMTSIQLRNHYKNTKFNEKKARKNAKQIKALSKKDARMISEVSHEKRKDALKIILQDETRKQSLATLLRTALADILLQYKNALVFGEDVGKKGGVYHVTAHLQKIFGGRRK